MFNPAGRTITFIGMDSIKLERVLIVVNTTRNVVMYNFAGTTSGGSVSGNVLTLQFNTSGFASSDALLIYYDDPNAMPALNAELQAANDIALAILEAVSELKVLAALRDTSGLRVYATGGSLSSVTNIPQLAGLYMNAIPYSINNSTAVLSNIG